MSSEQSAAVTESAVADTETSDSAATSAGTATPAEGNWLTRLRPASPVTGWVLLVTGILGLTAAASLTIERINLASNPGGRLSCDFSPIISCGSVMLKEQARFFGFPNPLLGIVAFAVIITTAVLTLGRVRLPRWYWIGQTIVTALGWVFVHYLMFQSIYRIGALCPYCMVVWTIVPIIFALSLSRALPDNRTGRSVREWLAVLLPVWYVIALIIIGIEFWYYWKTFF